MIFLLGKSSGSNFLPLYSDSLRFSEEIGFHHDKTVYMCLSLITGSNPNYNSKKEFYQLNMKKYKGLWEKVEPIIVLEKKIK